MKLNKKLKNKIEKMAILSGKIRILSREILGELEDKGVDIDCDEFMGAWAYLEGDCSSEEILEWIDDIVKQCDESDISVFMKNSLKKLMGDDFRQDKLIWEEKIK